MASLDLQCIETLVKEAGDRHLKAEKANGKHNTRQSKSEENENPEVPKLFMIMIRELTNQLLERQDNKFKEERDYLHDEIDKTDKKIDTIISEVKELRYQLDITSQQNRKDNLKIIGVPQTEGEDVNKIVIDIFKHFGVEITESDISVAHRISTKDDKEDPTSQTASGRPKRIPTIIVKCQNRNVKTRVFENRKQTSAKPGLIYPDAVIYEDVTPLRSRILYELRNRKEKDNEEKKMFKYVWSREGRMYCRTEEEAAQLTQPRPHIIHRPEDLKKYGWSDLEIEDIISNKRK